jgi:hypothetical protein
VAEDYPLRGAIDLMRASRAPAVIVRDRHGGLAGMITPRGLADMTVVLRKAHRGSGIGERSALWVGSLPDER